MIKNLSDSSSGTGIISYIYYNDTCRYNSKIVASHSSLNPDNNWGASSVLIDQSLDKLQSKYNWCSDNVEDSYFSINLLENVVKLHSYTISQRCVAEVHLFRSWKFEGSEYGDDWKLIDNKTMYMDQPFFTTCGSVNIQVTSQFYRFFKVTMTGKNSNDADYFVVSRFEIFGELWSLNSNSKIYQSCLERNVGIIPFVNSGYLMSFLLSYS